ncbi:MAG: hypothetical protein WCJ35_02015 [Planctomycetota bacterium]
MFANRKSSPKLSFEGLEKRLMMDGNITATFQAGNLLITGDKLANGVSIVGSAVPGEFVIQGMQTAYVPTTVNGKHSIIFEHVQNITIDLKAGDDILRVGNITGDLTRISGGLTVNPGPGNKTLTVTNVSVGGITSLATGAGNDLVTVEKLVAKKAFALETGAGNDTVKIRNSVFADLTVNLGGGNDGLVFAGNTVGRKGVLDSGAGLDSLNANWRKVSTGNISVINFETYF